METTTERLSVTREVLIEARPETVWEFLVDPEKISRWKGIAVSFEPAVGGAFRNEVIPNNIAIGEIVELDAPRRLVYTWGWEGNPAVPPGSTTVEYELIPEGGGTRLRLTHRDLPNSEAAESHAHGWAHYLQRLAVVASGGDPGVDSYAVERSE
ncbi:MAG: SRPBCC domain-containing protein [Actinobacteria bacterium]|nr:SRPBCC domain-containing protein [Actinomycetota bacterium]MBV8479179.1 SRPBCC domain-containing protein [Actinomycetota bacterium]